jgi:transglutaminase-like putative cysteine protease
MACPLYPARPEGSYRVNSFIIPDQTSNIAGNIYNTLRVRGEDTLENRIKEAFNFVSLRIRYLPDKKVHGYPEYWQFPRETLDFGTGDCEDTSFLLASLLLALRLSSEDVRVELGTWYGRGHAWVKVRLGATWYLLESTSDEPFPGWVTAQTGYVSELHIYQHRCERVGPIGIYTKQPLQY